MDKHHVKTVCLVYRYPIGSLATIKKSTKPDRYNVECCVSCYSGACAVKGDILKSRTVLFSLVFSLKKKKQKEVAMQDKMNNLKFIVTEVNKLMKTDYNLISLDSMPIANLVQILVDVLTELGALTKVFFSFIGFSCFHVF